jgi:hypothetical protein
MTDSADGERLTGQDGTTRGRPPRPSFTPSSGPEDTPTQRPGFSADGDQTTYPATEAAYPATEAGRPGLTDDAGWERTSTARGGPWPGGASAAPGQVPDSRELGAQGPGLSEERFGPGVPGSASAAGDAAVPAEEVWRTGRLPGPPPQRGRWRRRGAVSLTAVLLIACAAVVYLRLHHGPLKVTGVAIASQAQHGCTDDITGKISTSGGAGTVSYQWVLTPQSAAPQPLTQSVTAGQSAVYVTVSDQGLAHGQLAQQVTLQVLGPGQGKASTHVNITC